MKGKPHQSSHANGQPPRQSARQTNLAPKDYEEQLRRTTTTTRHSHAHANQRRANGAARLMPGIGSCRKNEGMVGSVHGNLFLYGQELAPCPHLRMVAGASLSLSLSASV